MFNETPPPTVIHKRMSFLSILILCVTATLITCILSASGIAVYGLRVVDRKSDTLLETLTGLAGRLPEFRAALPPALADALDDVREPEYLQNLAVTVSLSKGEGQWDRGRAVVEVQNKSDAMISLLSMRILGLDAEGNPTVERRAWAATPLQIDGDWRGPILPNATRKFVIRGFDPEETASVSYEITDIRVWRGYDESGTEAPDAQLQRAAWVAPNRL
jgi:hypothetical protein